MLPAMDALGSQGALGVFGAIATAVAGHVAATVADAPDDPVLLVGAMILAWLPLCALILAVLAVVARFQVHFLHRKQAPAAVALPPSSRTPPVTRRYMSHPPQTNGFVSAARLALAVVVVLTFSLIVLASSAPFLLASLAGHG
jgi:hypothetical protein